MLTNRRTLLAATASAGVLFACSRSPPATQPAETAAFALSDAEWRQRLSPDAYRVLRRADTEQPFTSALLNEHRTGTFTCAGCALPLFSSATKFESGTGWPSFWQPLADAVKMKPDYEFDMTRIEVHCRRCAGHLGHVFNDGPAPTGKRYCMNGVALGFEQENA